MVNLTETQMSHTVNKLISKQIEGLVTERFVLFVLLLFCKNPLTESKRYVNKRFILKMNALKNKKTYCSSKNARAKKSMHHSFHKGMNVYVIC